MTTWSPIDTAPRDGTPIDLWHENGFRITDAFWIAEEEIWTGVWEDKDLTHWMPIPEPPK